MESRYIRASGLPCLYLLTVICMKVTPILVINSKYFDGGMGGSTRTDVPRLHAIVSNTDRLGQCYKGGYAGMRVLIGKFAVVGMLIYCFDRKAYKLGTSVPRSCIAGMYLHHIRPYSTPCHLVDGIKID